MMLSPATLAPTTLPPTTWAFAGVAGWLCLLACLVLMPPAHALPVERLYVAEVLVTNEGAATLKAGARAGLRQVLIRVSGRLDVESNSLIHDALRQPETFYNQYSYDSTDRTLLVGAEQVPAQILTLHFEPSAIVRLLRQGNYPVWGSNRPGALLWIAISRAGKRELVTEEGSPEVFASLVDQARLRGLPLLFPLLDLEDTSQIGVAEVWGAFLGRIGQASMRYNPDAILTGRLQQDDKGRWSGQWSYRVAANWQTGAVNNIAFSVDELVRGMIDKLADELSARYALGSSRGRVRILVEGVRDLVAYAALSEYLAALTPVLNSSVVSLKDDVVEFELQTEGQQVQLVETIELDQRLVLLSHSSRRASSDDPNPLRYRWTR